ncbi:MAG: ice-binding family protein, partial [Dysgonamonadaceae bacterium]
MLDKTTLIKGKNPLRKNKWLSGYLIMPLLITLLLSVFMTQCKEDDFEGEITGVCPLVILTDPADGAVKVPLNKMITATFNEEMDPTTINATSFILMEGANSISGTVTPVSGNKAAFNFTPSSPLKPSTLYTATMKKGVRDPMRNALQEDYVWSFTTIGQHTVALSSNPEDGGTTTGEGLYETDASVTIEAVAAEGYTFTNWTEGEDIFTSKADTTFNITENRTLVANFTTIKYSVTLSSNPEEGGTTTGAGTYDLGAEVTVEAVAAEGYTFTNWTEGEEIVSSDAEYTFTITDNRNLVANFTTVKYTVALSSNPLIGGTTSGAGSFDSGDEVTVKAVPATGYTFKNWTEGGNIVSTTAEYKFTITKNRTLVANFEADIVQFNVMLSSNPPNGGTTTGGGTYNSGTSVTVKAVANTGYTFKNWTEGANIVSTDADYTFNITTNRALVANFEADSQQFNVALSSNPSNGGTTTGGGTYNSGTSVTVKAVANTGYTFTNWTEGGNPVYSNANYTFTITGNRTLVANFTATPPSGPSIIDLTCAEPYAVLAGSTITNTGPSIINGDVGLSPGSALEGFPPGIINGVQQITTPAAADAKLCLTEAYLDGQGRSLNSISLPGNLGGLTLAPGLYTNSSTTGITGTGANGILTLDAQGNANAVWIFQIGSTLTTDPATSIVLAGGAQAKNIFWIVGS